jgi:hypothetical protein
VACIACACATLGSRCTNSGSQATATRRAFHGWLYISPLDPATPTVRKFKSDVRKLTQSEFGIALSENDKIDPAAAKLYDGIFLWARALSRVFANNGAPMHAERLTSGALWAACLQWRRCAVRARTTRFGALPLPSGGRRDGKAMVKEMGGIVFPSEPSPDHGRPGRRRTSAPTLELLESLCRYCIGRHRRNRQVRSLRVPRELPDKRRI